MRTIACSVCGHVIDVRPGEGVERALCRMHSLKALIDAGIADQRDYDEWRALLAQRLDQPAYGGEEPLPYPDEGGEGGNA